MPALFAGGVCCAVGVEDFEVEADFVEPDDELAGAGAGAAAGVEAGADVGAGLDAGAELAVELGVEPAAGADESAAAVSDFFERFFFVVVELESAVVDEPAAGVAAP